MSNGSNNPQQRPSPPDSNPGSTRERGHWWQARWIYRCYCRLANLLYDWWHPAPEHSRAYYGYGRMRRTRLGQAWSRLRRRVADFALVHAWRNLFARLDKWWHPTSKRDSSRSSYGYYGAKRRSRLMRLRQRIAHRFRTSTVTRAWGRLVNAFYNWWYPLVDDASSSPAYGYHGPRRRSRPAQVLNRVRRRLGVSLLGRAWQRTSVAVWEWWYPEVEGGGRGYGYGYGYYGHGRVSRLRLALRRLGRWWRQTRLGLLRRRFSIAAWEWWYPEPDATSRGYGYQRLQVCRPVRFLHRALRWFRGTWLGRKLRWLLDDIEAHSWRVRSSLAVTLGRENLRWWLMSWQTWVLLVFLGSLLGGGYVYGLPRYRSLQERQYARQAEMWLKKGDLPRAMLRARQTISLNPSNAIATRVVGDVFDSYNMPSAMYWRQRTVLFSPTATNHLSLASTALRFESFPFPIAARALEDVPGAARATFAYHYLAGSLAWKMNDLQAAERHYAEAVKLDPENPAARMSLAVVHMYSRDPESVPDARATLESLRTDRSVGLLALRSLVAESIDRGDWERAEALSRQVLTNAQTAMRDHIMHLAILNTRKQPDLPKFLEETQTRAGKNVLAIGELAAWMIASGRARETLDWLDTLPAEVLRLGLLPITRADAFVALGAWKELEADLRRSPWPGLDHVRFAMLTLATWKQTGGSRQSVAWNMALHAASASPATLNMLAELVGTWGWTEEAESTLWHAADRFGDQPWPLQRLERYYQSRRDSAGLLRVSAAKLRRNAEDRLALNNHAMISMLMNRDLAEARRVAAELHDAEPGNPVFTSTYAFSLHVQGRTKEALALLRDLGLDQLDDPSMSLYYGVMLVADGQTEIAQTYLKRGATAYMLPEEAALLQRATKQ